MQNLTSLMKKASSSKKYLWLLNQLLKFGIPFNRPHGFKVCSIEMHEVKTFAPHHKKNFNHLRGIHACAIATVGELAAGLMLMHHFSSSKYRLIMSHLDIEYHYQAKKDIVASATLSSESIINIMQAMSHSEKVLHEILTIVHDVAQNKIATVKTVWQIKQWSKVNTQR